MKVTDAEIRKAHARYSTMGLAAKSVSMSVAGFRIRCSRLGLAAKSGRGHPKKDRVDSTPERTHGYNCETGIGERECGRWVPLFATACSKCSAVNPHAAETLARLAVFGNPRDPFDNEPRSPENIRIDNMALYWQRKRIGVTRGAGEFFDVL